MAVQIVHAVALVVSGLPPEQRRAGLTALMGPIVEQLQAALLQGRPLSANGALNGGSAGASHAQSSASVDLILVERLTTLFRSASMLSSVVNSHPATGPLLCSAN